MTATIKFDYQLITIDKAGEIKHDRELMDVENLVLKASADVCKSALAHIIGVAMNPALGSASKRELELSVLEALTRLNAIPKNPTTFQLMRELRISKGRARGLLYDRDIRSMSKEMLDDMARSALSKPRLLSKGHAIAVDIDNPLLSEHIKDVVRSMGYTSDNSFSSSLIQLNDEAAAALIDYYVPEATRKAALSVFHKAGMKDKSLKGVLVGMIRHGAGKLAGEAGDAVAKHLSETVGSLLGEQGEELGKAISSFLDAAKLGKVES